MYGKLKTAVSALRNKAVLYCAAAFLAVSGFVSSVYAEGNTVSIEIPDTGLDWTNTSDSIMGAIAEPLGIGIGIGLAVWLVLLAVKLLKKPVK